MIRRLCFCLLFVSLAASAREYRPVNDRPPAIAREFRGAWIATVHNIDWPSRKGLGASAQQAELRAILDKLAALKMNAVVFQVRPQCDALYASSFEPWSPWLTGTMGKSPGYDPLAYCIREAHARGIEVHAWFNPFRALSNSAHPVSSDHVARKAPHLIKRYGNHLWCDPAHPETRGRALKAILEVVDRYDIDGVHLDDYFYPYPVAGKRFPDGKSPAQRRAFVDEFVQRLYGSVKARKPWVRVGISPFGIWKPGVPEGIEAGIDSCEDLAGDSRKWLRNGWVDYLAPQLYWRISPEKQSFPKLLAWWRDQGKRPVWPGIATSRIQSTEDPGRPAAEITEQIALSRQIGGTGTGHIHWSVKSLMTNRGGIAGRLASSYTQQAVVPAMPWSGGKAPEAPAVGATLEGDSTSVRWQAAPGTARMAIQARQGGQWRTMRVVPARVGKAQVPRAEAVAVTAIDRFGHLSRPKVLGL
ncbi:MAG: hypothetical protein FJ385_09400 [Verrucomicrobia bacterium]|nr:hypothetical protein [Verrucomicrobiota bacterium]